MLWICNILYGRPTDQLTFLLLSWLAGHAQQICKLLTFTFLWLGPQRDLRICGTVIALDRLVSLWTDLSIEIGARTRSLAHCEQNYEVHCFHVALYSFITFLFMGLGRGPRIKECLADKGSLLVKLVGRKNKGKIAKN